MDEEEEPDELHVRGLGPAGGAALAWAGARVVFDPGLRLRAPASSPAGAAAGPQAAAAGPRPGPLGARGRLAARHGLAVGSGSARAAPTTPTTPTTSSVVWADGAGVAELQAAAEAADAVLVTEPQWFRGLPFVTELSRFRGAVLATEAAARIGRQFVLELLAAAEAADDSGGAADDSGGAAEGRRLYSRREALAALGRVRSVKYGEAVEVVPGVRATAHPSGAGIGSAFWVLAAGQAEVGYVARLCLDEGFAAPLRLAALLPVGAVVCGLPLAVDEPGLSSAEEEDAAAVQGIDGVINAVVKAVTGGGCALIPVNPSGQVLELLEVLAGYLAAYGLSHVPIYYVSETAEDVLAYANLSMEWLSEPRQRRIYKRAGPEPPFGHHKLLQAGRLQPVASLAGHGGGWAEPCIAVVPLASVELGAGPGAQLVALWRLDPASVLVLTEERPQATLERVARRHGELRMQVVTYVLAATCAPEDLAHVLEAANPPRLVFHEDLLAQCRHDPYAEPFFASRPDILRFPRGRAAEAGGGAPPPARVPLPARALAAVAHAQLAQRLARDGAVVPGLPGVEAVRARVVLDLRDGRARLLTREAAAREGLAATRLEPATDSLCVWGQVALPALLAALRGRGLAVRGVEERAATAPDGVVEPEALVALEDGTEILLGPNRTTISSAGPALAVPPGVSDAVLGLLHVV